MLISSTSLFSFKFYVSSFYNCSNINSNSPSTHILLSTLMDRQNESTLSTKAFLLIFKFKLLIKELKLMITSS